YTRHKASDRIHVSHLSATGLDNYVSSANVSLAPNNVARINHAGTFRKPVHVYSHAGGNCSVTGGYVYRGSAVPSARGRYFYGDYCSGKIWSFVPAGGKATDVRQEPLAVDSLSSFGEDARGELYATSLKGTVYQLTG